MVEGDYFNSLGQHTIMEIDLRSSCILLTQHCSAYFVSTAEDILFEALSHSEWCLFLFWWSSQGEGPAQFLNLQELLTF
jgi:hypothetical protein